MWHANPGHADHNLGSTWAHKGVARIVRTLLQPASCTAAALRAPRWPDAVTINCGLLPDAHRCCHGCIHTVQQCCIRNEWKQLTSLIARVTSRQLHKNRAVCKVRHQRKQRLLAHDAARFFTCCAEQDAHCCAKRADPRHCGLAQCPHGHGLPTMRYTVMQGSHWQRRIACLSQS